MFALESELVPPIRGWLQAAGLRVHGEVSILGRRADVLGVGPNRLVAVELKLEDWAEAVRQATAYQLAADEAWVAMPLASAGTAYRHRWRFADEGVGLLAVDDRGEVRTPIPALPSPRLLPFARDALRTSLAGPLFSKGETDLEAF